MLTETRRVFATDDGRLRLSSTFEPGGSSVSAINSQDGLRERAEHYRELAHKADVAARRMNSEGLREGWLKIAQDWVELAVRVEGRLESQARPTAPSAVADENAHVPRDAGARA